MNALLNLLPRNPNRMLQCLLLMIYSAYIFCFSSVRQFNLDTTTTTTITVFVANLKCSNCQTNDRSAL